MTRPITQEERLTKTLATLANPTRRALIALLMHKSATVNELAEPFDISLPAISKHLSILEEANLITREKQAQFRLCSINIEPIKALFEWTDQFRHMWEERFDNLEQHLAQIQEDPNDKA